MKKLIVARHGWCDLDEHLDDCGVKEIRILGDNIKKIADGERVLILSSTAPRGRESAEILSCCLGVGFEEYDILWSDNSHPENMPEVLKLVRSRKDEADVIILVTHYEYAGRFPAYFAKEELGENIPSSLIGNAEAWILDCENKILTRVYPEKE